jgi:hypothetical protein
VKSAKSDLLVGSKIRHISEKFRNYGAYRTMRALGTEVSGTENGLRQDDRSLEPCNSHTLKQVNECNLLSLIRRVRGD